MKNIQVIDGAVNCVYRESRWRSRCPTAGRAFFRMGGVLSSRDWSRAQGLTTQSRNGYALVSLCAVAAAGVGVGMWLAQVRLLFRDVFSKVAA